MNDPMIKEIIKKTIPVKIDGKNINASEGSTVLETAQKAGIYIPTLCNLENLQPFGGCRLCIVEIKNMRGYPTACTTPVSPDMEIVTSTPELQALRREILELILSEHPYTCLVCKDKIDCKEYMTTTRKVTTTTGCNFCPNNGKCELQNLAEYLDLKDINYPVSYKDISPVKDNPFYEFDYNLCILCGRCVRICNEERNSNVLSFIKRGNTAMVGTAFNETHKDAGCEYCGACVDVCPTGSISEKIGKWAGTADKSTKTFCPYCPVACEININTRKNHIVNIGPDTENRTNPLQICVRGKFTPANLVHHPERIRKPQIRKGSKWIEVTWDEAINYTASNLERYRGNQFGVIGSSHDTLENNYSLQKFSRKIMRSNNADLYPSSVNKNLFFSIYNYNNSFSPANIDDILTADTILVIGAQAYSSHPIIENRIRKAYKNGKEIIVANSGNNRTFDFATQNILYQPGEENSFLLTLLGNIVKEKPDKASYELKKIFENFNFEKASELHKVNISEIEPAVKSIISAKKIIIVAGDGILQHPESINNFNALYNIQLLLNKPEDCRILFLLNEGNYFGGALLGMHPCYFPDFNAVSDENNYKKWSENWGTNLSNIPGLSGEEIINNIAEDGITALFLVGDIPPHANLGNLKFFVQQNMFFTETSKYANVLLPMTSFTEITGHIINIEQKIKEIIPSILPLDDVRTPWSAISMIAQAMYEKGFSFNNNNDIFNEIQSYIDLSFAKRTSKKTEFLPVKTDLPEITEESHTHGITEKKYFHYFGNNLPGLIPDMKAILEERIIDLSTEHANK